MPRLTETRALRATLPEDEQSFLWCSEIRGFGCRLLATGVRSWVVQPRISGKSKRITLGPVGTLPFEGPPDHSSRPPHQWLLQPQPRRGGTPGGLRGAPRRRR